MKANLNKCHILLSYNEKFNFQISETLIHKSYSKKLTGVTFDNNLQLRPATLLKRDSHTGVFLLNL